jgi:hypothetical protein
MPKFDTMMIAAVSLAHPRRSVIAGAGLAAHPLVDSRIDDCNPGRAVAPGAKPSQGRQSFHQLFAGLSSLLRIVADSNP